MTKKTLKFTVGITTSETTIGYPDTVQITASHYDATWTEMQPSKVEAMTRHNRVASTLARMYVETYMKNHKPEDVKIKLEGAWAGGNKWIWLAKFTAPRLTDF